MIKGIAFQDQAPVGKSIDQVSADAVWSATYGPDGAILNGLGGDPKWNDIQRPDYNNLVGQGQDRFYGQVYGVVALDPTQVSDIVAVLQTPGVEPVAIGLESVRMGWNFNSPSFLDLAFYKIGRAGIPLEGIGDPTAALLDIRRPGGQGAGMSPADDPQPLFDLYGSVKRAGPVLASAPWDACGLAADVFVNRDENDEWCAIEKPEAGVSRLVLVYAS